MEESVNCAEPLKKTCLYEKHVALGAQMSPFGGFIMPIQYSDITTEHNAVRHACGLFDVSHMGEISVSGEDAEMFVNHIFTNDVRDMPVGKILYGMMLYPSGGTVDDLLVYKMAQKEFLLVVNAANIDKDYRWILKAYDEMAPAPSVKIEDKSDGYGQVALQGPDSETVAEKVLGLSLEDLVFYTFKETELWGEKLIASRTGYTGEDGFEFYGSHELIAKIWDALIAAGVQPCGLGCRDTLRFEVGLPLYGHELNDGLTPLEAGLGMFVKLDKDEFLGKEPLMALKAEGLKKKIVGIELTDKAIPRAGYAVLADGQPIGEVTTGYNSISTGKSVCMALIDSSFATQGTEVVIQIRKRVFSGTVCKKRFYDKKYKK